MAVAKRRGKARRGARKNDTLATPPLVTQPHGGALYASGVSGNVGGSGRPPSEIRDRLRGLAYDRLESVLAPIADGDVTVHLRQRCEFCRAEPTAQDPTDIVKQLPTPGERRASVEAMLKYGVGTTKEVSNPEQITENLRAMRRIIRATLPTDQAEPLLAEIRAHWK